MKTLIVGAGIIGSIYGWAFEEAGHDVTHFVRPGRAAQFANGMTIDMLDARKGHKKQFTGRYPIRTTETLHPSDRYELVVVPTKHYYLVETLRQIVPQTGNTDYLLLTQNWDGTEDIDSILPQSSYVFGDAKAGGSFENDTLVATIASIDIGQVGGQQEESLRKTVALCKSADIEVNVHEEILQYLWVQYALTGGLWPALVRAGIFEVVLNDRRIAEQALQAARESLAVVTRRGVNLQKYPEVRMYLNNSPIATWMARLGLKLMFRFNKFMQRSSAHALNDPQEVKVFYYDLLDTGRKLGVEMPAMSDFEPDILKFAGGKS